MSTVSLIFFIFIVISLLVLGGVFVKLRFKSKKEMLKRKRERDRFLTNFHLLKTVLLMCLSAYSFFGAFGVLLIILEKF